LIKKSGVRNAKKVIKAVGKKIMKKTKSSINEFRLNRIGFLSSSTSIYKEKFSNSGIEMTFKPKFSVTKNITFSNQKKIANNLAKAFKTLIPLKF